MTNLRRRLAGQAAHRARAGVLAAALSFAAIASAAAQTTGDQKILKIVVGFSPGGGYDTYARILARHIGRHIPGQPSVIVQNMPGAAGLKAVQYLDTGAPQDGTVITAFNPGSITESLVDAERIRFKFTEVAWIGSITRDLRVCYAWAATGIKTWDDLKKYKQFNMGAPAQGTSSFVNSAILKNMFGISVHHVMGYPGSVEQRLAIERGELDGDCGAWSSVPPDWIAGKKVNPIVSFSPDPIPGLSQNIPFVGDLTADPEAKALLAVLTTPDTLGRPYVVSKQVPRDRLAVLRAAFDATMQDSGFVAETDKLDLPLIGPIGGAEAEKMIESFYAVPPAFISRAQAIVGK